MTDQQPAARGQGRRFHLKQRIGEGAFGQVFLAEQDSGAGFRRPVALKLLAEGVSGSREAARRMRDEARILGRLSHRHIVSVLDLVRLGDRWAVVMDYVPGADLEQVLHALELTKGEFPPAAAFEVGAAVARALHAAFHAEDGTGGTLAVVHRDIKPSNVRVTEDGEVKVLDFGVARVNLATRESSTRAGGWIGTERYMAPERILIQGDTPAGDVYALAASIVELVVGRPLGRTPVLDEPHTEFVDAALVDVRETLKGPPEVVDKAVDLLRRGLASDPTLRPSAREVADACAELSRRLEGESLHPFCRRFLPTVGEVLGYVAVPVDGVLSERSGEMPEAEEGRATATILPSSGARSSPDVTYVDAGTPAPRVRRMPPSGGRVLALAATAAALLVVVAGGATFAGLNAWFGSPDRPPAVPVTIEEPPPVATVEAGTAAEVEPEPEPEVATVVEAASAGSDVEVAPEPVPSPRPRARPAPAPVPVEPVPRVGRAQVSLANASSIEVLCGDRRFSGTASVRLTDFPAGSCRVRATWLGDVLETDVVIERPVGVTCSVEGGALTCR